MKATLGLCCTTVTRISCALATVFVGLACQTHPSDCTWWGDSWRLGDAKAITKSTLQEHEFVFIAQRICALAYLATANQVYGKTPSAAEQRNAEEGLLVIQDRLVHSQWQVSVYNTARKSEDLRAFLAGYMYFVCANFGVSREFYDKLHPPKDRPELIEKWEKMLAVLERKRVSVDTSDARTETDFRSRV